jgi:hypothetical protein
LTAPDFRRGTRVDGRTFAWFGLIVHLIALGALIARWHAPRSSWESFGASAPQPLLQTIFDWALVAVAVAAFAAIAAITRHAFRSRAKTWPLALPALAPALVFLLPTALSASFIGSARAGASAMPELGSALLLIEADVWVGALGHGARALYVAALTSSSAAIAWAAIALEGSDARFSPGALTGAGLGTAALGAITAFAPPETIALVPAWTACAILWVTGRRPSGEHDASPSDALAAFTAAVAGLVLIGSAAWCEALAARPLDVSSQRALEATFVPAQEALRPILYCLGALGIGGLIVFAGHGELIRAHWRPRLPAFAALALTIALPSTLVAVRSSQVATNAKTAAAELSKLALERGARGFEAQEPVTIGPHELDDVLKKMTNDAAAEGDDGDPDKALTDELF